MAVEGRIRCIEATRMGPVGPTRGGAEARNRFSAGGPPTLGASGTATGRMIRASPTPMTAAGGSSRRPVTDRDPHPAAFSGSGPTRRSPAVPIAEGAARRRVPRGGDRAAPVQASAASRALATGRRPPPRAGARRLQKTSPSGIGPAQGSGGRRATGQGRPPAISRPSPGPAGPGRGVAGARRPSRRAGRRSSAAATVGSCAGRGEIGCAGGRRPAPDQGSTSVVGRALYPKHTLIASQSSPHSTARPSAMRAS